MNELSVPKAILARRSVRHLLPTPVGKDVLDRITRLAMEAPSSWNHQSRSVVIVNDTDARAALVRATGGQRAVAQAPVTLVFVGELDHPEADHSAMHEVAMDRGAWSAEYAETSVFTARTFQQGLKDKGLLREYAVKDAMIAASFCMLAAQSEGLATAPMNGWEEQAVKQVIGIEDRDDLAIALVMALGYADHVPAHPGRLSDKHIFANNYGQPAAFPDNKQLGVVHGEPDSGSWNHRPSGG